MWSSWAFDVLTNVQNARGYFVEYLLERPDVKDVWKQFVHHPFVMAIGDGSLPRESFKGYLVQDYLYLVSLKLTVIKRFF